MRAPAFIPAVALLAGAVWGIHVEVSSPSASSAVAACLLCAVAARARARQQLVVVAVAAAAWGIGAILADAARTHAMRAPLRRVLAQEVGGFSLESIGPGENHDPIRTRLRIREDAASAGAFVSLRADVIAIRLEDAWIPAAGGVALSVSGAAFPHSDVWTAGRVIEAPVTFRRPARYLNDGVRDLERDLALDGITLFGSIKSALVVTIVQPATWIEERAATVRRHVREAVRATTGRHSPLTAAIVIAVLIGDRTGLPDEIRERLQRAGTYHVIAISGGNIAILAAIIVSTAMLVGCRPRLASGLTVVALLAYGAVAAGGPSVRRATTMAIVYLIARTLDHRAAPMQSVSIAAILVVCAYPLDVRDAGFLLTFGATGALLLAAYFLKPQGGRRTVSRWLRDAAIASLAVEAVLLPVGVAAFSRVTVAGLVLNFAAIPLMTIVQVAGIVAVAVSEATPFARAAGWLAHASASMLIESARLVDVWTWLTWRVPAPDLPVIGLYYTALAVAVWGRHKPGVVIFAGAASCAMAVCIAFGTSPLTTHDRPDIAFGSLRLTMNDVGQGDSIIVELPDGSRMLVDAGGAPFGGGAFDIGGRVLAPALWARGIRHLDRLLVTHGDPDHIGGALRTIEDFAPVAMLEGIPVSRHAGLSVLHAGAARAGTQLQALRDGMEWTAGAARLRVLHPPEPDWERPTVRNDDSVVIEVLFGDVAVLLTGDISSEIEREIAPRLTPARIRILKVAHHGSRTSTSAALVESWRPHFALISAGRGNRFGHPAPEVLRRLEAARARIYRTDRDGQITITTDGRTVGLQTFVGGRLGPR